jgi:hypothetical protein
VPKDKISIQLYTLRSVLETDLEGTLDALADIGYRKVELAGTYGRSAAEFRKLLDARHIRATSTHVGIDGDIDQAIADAKVLGNRGRTSRRSPSGRRSPTSSRPRARRTGVPASGSATTTTTRSSRSSTACGRTTC